MKTNAIITLLESIDKNELLVTFSTKNKTSAESTVVIGKNLDFHFKLKLVLDFFAFGNSKKPDFAIPSKTVQFEGLENKSGEIIKVDEYQKLLIEYFFKNFIIAYIKIVKSIKATKIKTTA